MSTIKYRDKEWDVDDIRQEEVCGMSCQVIDMIVEKLKIMGFMDADIQTVLENDCYDDVMAYFEKMFNYPEYRNHN